jgi:KipI family sensor histidine kinase inhibitor
MILDTANQTFPKIAAVGLGGLLIQFSDHMAEAPNRAAMALRAALEKEGWPEVREISASLASTFLQFDTLGVNFEDLYQKVKACLDAQDWYAAPLPEGRKHYHIPCAFDPDLAPDLEKIAAQVGLSVEDAIADLCAQTVRVYTVGFAPGQPYMGPLRENWDIPRNSELNPRVPKSALIVAIRQAIIFTTDAPTGWFHIGQTAFENFCPALEDPFPLRPGNEASFYPITREELENLKKSETPNAGVTVRAIS